jgi:hypothetical protein
MSEEPKLPKTGGLVDWRQARILSDRYLETVLADWKNTGLLLIQAPLLAAMVVAVWGNVGEATPSLYFVMALSAIWLGCTDACREIVKERPLFLRERMVNLDVGAYLYSKLRVLALLNVAQIAAYTLIVANWVQVRVPVTAQGAVLLATCLCGTCLGLLISAAVQKSDYAVGLVPLVILPQILFSEFAISPDQFTGFSDVAYRLMPAGWAYESLVEFAQTDPDWLRALGMQLPLLGFGAVFMLLAYPLLRMARY